MSSGSPSVGPTYPQHVGPTNSTGIPTQGSGQPVTASSKSLPTSPSPRVSLSQLDRGQAPEGSVLAEIGDVLSVIFVGKESSALRDHFALYNPPKEAGVLRTGCEILKATGRAAALVVGSLLVGTSRAIALGGSAFLGGLLTITVMASVVGLLWMILAKDSVEVLHNAGKFLGSAAAAVPAFVGACCQQLAFQNPNSNSTITTDNLFETTWKQHFGDKSETVSLSGIGSGIGVAVGILLALLGKAALGIQ